MRPVAAALDAPSASPAGRPQAAWQRMAAALVALAGVAAASAGGAIGMAGALLALAAGTFAMSWGTTRASATRPAPVVQPMPPGTDPDDDAAGRPGAALMVRQVVPVWNRQILATRDVADQGLAQLLEAFAGFSNALDTLASQLGQAGLAAAPGAVDDALEQHHEALAALLAPSERAFAERDAAVQELGRCAQGLGELEQLSKQAREIARHTRLVAFNATIEAQRGHGGNGGHALNNGAQAVAGEVRMLSGRMAEIADQVDAQVRRMRAAIDESHRRGQIADTTPEELRLEIAVRAREALKALLDSLGASLQGSVGVQQASSELRRQIDEAFVHFQFGDRVSQMLAIVGTDMDNLVRWLATHPTATQSDAAEWLAALESSYTMEEQRSRHHGNVHVDRGSEIDFF